MHKASTVEGRRSGEAGRPPGRQGCAPPRRRRKSHETAPARHRFRTVAHRKERCHPTPGTCGAECDGPREVPRHGAGRSRGSGAQPSVCDTQGERMGTPYSSSERGAVLHVTPRAKATTALSAPRRPRAPAQRDPSSGDGGRGAAPRATRRPLYTIIPSGLQRRPAEQSEQSGAPQSTMSGCAFHPSRPPLPRPAAMRMSPFWGRHKDGAAAHVPACRARRAAGREGALRRRAAPAPEAASAFFFRAPARLNFGIHQPEPVGKLAIDLAHFFG